MNFKPIILLILSILFASPALSEEINWKKSHPFNVIGQKDLKKPVLMYFYYDGCSWCGVMQDETWSDPDTIKFVNKNFIAVKVDNDKYPEVSRFYKVTAFPSIVLGRKDNSVRLGDKQTGYKSPEQLKRILENFLKSP